MAELDCVSLITQLNSIYYYNYYLQPSSSGLSITVLHDKIKTPLHVKPKGRPKQSGTLWPSKQKKRGLKRQFDEKEKGKKSKKSKVEESKENHCSPIPSNDQSMDALDKGKKKAIELESRKSKDLKGYIIGTPVFRSRKCRERKQKLHVSSSEKEEICLDDNDVLSGATYVDSVLKLSEEDFVRLQECQWLNDNLINAGQMLIKQKYDAKGLQDVMLSRTLSFSPEHGEFIQLIHSNENHWVCVSNIGCKSQVLKVYDSAQTGDLSIDALESIAAIIQSPKRNIYLQFPEVQQQTDSYSCGLFALAYACTLAEGNDPCRTIYPSHQMELASHFCKCLQKHNITSFQLERNLYQPGPFMKKVLKVYCLCRLPDSGDSMILCQTCREWFHYTCVAITKAPKGPYNCSKCSC